MYGHPIEQDMILAAIIKDRITMVETNKSFIIM